MSSQFHYVLLALDMVDLSNSKFKQWYNNIIYTSVVYGMYNIAQSKEMAHS